MKLWYKRVVPFCLGSVGNTGEVESAVSVVMKRMDSSKVITYPYSLVVTGEGPTNVSDLTLYFIILKTILRCLVQWQRFHIDMCVPF